MKHKTLRTLLCVILTVCFCLSAIAPVSAAGLFGGDSGAASIFDEWIRSLKDRFMEKNPGTDETPAEPLAGAGDDFIRIFHLDCGRRYFSVDEIKGIIDTLEAKKYTHIELAFGNDGLRFLLDDLSVTANGKEYSNADVTAAIQAGNRAYYSNGQNELSEADMNTIIAYANEHHISVIPLINMPGHSNALITAMAQLFGVNRNSLYTYENSNGGQAFKVVDNEKAVAFAKELAKKYVDYFSAKGSAYFNIGADECGYTTSGSDYSFENTIAADLLNPMAEYIVGKGMKPMMFNDGFNTNGALQNALTANTYGRQFTICYWDYNKRTTAADLNQAGFGIINTHNKWYYVAGNENNEWFGYDWAKNNLNGEYKNCSVCDSGFTKPNGCMLAYWCDKPTDAKAPKLDRVKELIGILSDNNTEKFTGNLSMPAKPAISGAPSSVQISDGTVNVSSSIAARWTSSNNSVITFEDAATKAAADSASYTETATARIVGAGTAIITATTANRGWAVQTVTVTNNGGTTTPSAKTITVTVGGTSTDTINGANYKNGTWTVENESIATISVDGVDATETEGYTQVKVSYSTLANRQSSWTKTNYYYLADDGEYYPIYAYRYKYYDDYYCYYYGYLKNPGDESLTQIDSSWSGNETVTAYTYDGKITVPASTTVTFKGIAAGTTYVTVGNVRYTINVTAEILTGKTLPIQLWITNIPIEVDTTAYAGGSTSGSFRSNNKWSEQKAWYVSVSANDAYGENGVPLSKVLPESMTRYENNITYWINEQSEKTAKELVLWSGRVHTSSDNNIQKIWDVDYSNSGTEFNYVRYYKGVWEVSENGGKDGEWIAVTGDGSTNSYSCSEQLAVYYMIRSAITKEVTTDIADWGFFKNDSDYATQIASGNYVMLDFAVKYEDGTRNPNTFPQDGKTFVFHCNTGDSSGAVQQDSSGNYYRRLNNFRAVNTSDYEVYMVTVTMTSDSASTIIADTTDYSYDTDEATGKKAGQEKLIWAIDEDTWTNSELPVYTAITSGDTTYSFDATKCIGGDPYVRGVEVYNQHGALITYYVRAKKLPDQTITVHYIDKDTNTEFFSYDIIVKNGTVFDAEFKLVNGVLDPNHNKVTNSLGFEQTISSELKDMLSVPAQYRRWLYTCVDAFTKDPYKDAYLYYTFNNRASFVVDFGLPLVIQPTQVSVNLAGATIQNVVPKGNKYGDITFDSDGNVTYTLRNKTLDEADSFSLYYTGVIDGGTTASTVEYAVSIIPASNVYYEENFISEIAGKKAWTLAGETVTNVYQATEKAYAELPEGNTTGINDDKLYVYGYDDNVASSLANTTGYSMGSAYHAQVTYSSDKEAAYTGDGLTFTFTGTGFDLISECSNKTGALVVRVVGAKTGYSKTYYIDTYFRGDTQNIIGEGSRVYQVPVLRSLNLDYDTYKVTVYGALLKKSGVVTPPVYATNAVSAYSMDYTTDAMRELLDACGMSDVFAEDVEIIYMDENSVLNGGTGVFGEEVVQPVFNSYAVNAVNEGTTTVTADVYVDAFRVYNPLETESAVYKNDKEDGVTYMSAYDFIAARTGDVSQDTTAILYVEYNAKLNVSEISTYRVNGPENEIYLAPGCGIAFGLSGLSDTDPKLQISAKVVSGDPTLEVGEAEKVNSVPINATEMYYDIVSNINLDNGKRYVVIKNTSEDTTSVLAISGLKLSAGTEVTALDSDIQDQILQSFNKQKNSSTEFVPEVFTVSVPETVRKNRNFTVSIATSIGDVKSVTIQMDGTDDIYTLTPKNLSAVEIGRATCYNYSKTFKIKEPGTYTFTIKAFDENGNSAVIHKTVTVSAK